jgi:hypothetical protein
MRIWTPFDTVYEGRDFGEEGIVVSVDMSFFMIISWSTKIRVSSGSSGKRE